MASLLGKHQIAINTASLADGDSIASYLVSASGALVASISIGGNESVYVKSASEFAEDSAHVSGDYGSQILAVRNDAGTSLVDTDGDYSPLSLDADGNLRVNATINFSGDYPEDSAHVSGDIGLFSLAVRRDVRTSGVSADGDYASFNMNAVGELWVKDADTLAQLVTIEGTLVSILADTATIDSQTLAIQNLITALSKSEDAAHVSGDQGIQSLAVRKDAQGSNVSADGDYSSIQTWSEGSLKVVDISNGTILQQQVSVTNVAAQVPATNLANRKSLMIQNTGANKLYIGSATVTSSGATTGIELPANSFMELEVGPAVNVYAIKVGAAGNNLNVLETA